MKPNRSRRSRSLTYLFIALALLGIVVALTGSKVALAVYVVAYVAVFAAFGVMAWRGGR